MFIKIFCFFFKKFFFIYHSCPKVLIIVKIKLEISFQPLFKIFSEYYYYSDIFIFYHQIYKNHPFFIIFGKSSY